MGEVIQGDSLQISYAKTWASKDTFTLRPMKRILAKYVGDGKGWIDPFAGDNSPAEFTNDLNSKKKAKWHMEAAEFIIFMASKAPFNGILFDPPYSPYQIKKCYESIGLKNAYKNESWYFEVVRRAAPLIKPNGYAIQFGWNSNIFCKHKGFKIVEIVLVSHTANHHDTIITVNKKIDGNLEAFTIASQSGGGSGK